MGISEEAVLQKFAKMTPIMKVIGKGKSSEVTTFTRHEAVPGLVDISDPTEAFEIGNFVSFNIPVFALT